MKVVEKYIKILTKKNYSIRTIETYSHYLEKFLNELNKNPYHISTKDIEKYLLNRKYSSVSQQNQIIGSIKLFAKYILNKKKVHLNKIERPRKERKLPQIIDKDILKEKILSIKNTKHKAILSLGYSCGLRVSEILNLKIKDIDSKRMLINILQAKGKKDRVVPLSLGLLDILRDYFKEHKPSVYLFNGQFSDQYSATSCNKIIKKYVSDSSYMHQLRHSCFTHLLEGGTDLRIIQSIAGHKNSKTTEIYTHVSNNLLQNVMMPI